jgi:hypothetical protein
MELNTTTCPASVRQPLLANPPTTQQTTTCEEWLVLLEAGEPPRTDPPGEMIDIEPDDAY